MRFNERAAPRIPRLDEDALEACLRLRALIEDLGDDGWWLLRFWSKVDVPEDRTACWEWRGLKDEDGYGLFYVGGGRKGAKRKLAHVVAYEMLIGPVEPGKQLDHECSNTSCISPWHLEQVTNLENHRRRSERRTHCKRGHELTSENTYSARGRRECLTCRQIASKRSNAKRRRSLAHSR